MVTKYKRVLLAKVTAKADEKMAKNMLLRSVRDFSGTIFFLPLWDVMCHTYLIGLPLPQPLLPCSVHSALRGARLEAHTSVSAWCLPLYLFHS